MEPVSEWGTEKTKWRICESSKLYHLVNTHTHAAPVTYLQWKIQVKINGIGHQETTKDRFN